MKPTTYPSLLAMLLAFGAAGFVGPDANANAAPATHADNHLPRVFVLGASFTVHMGPHMEKALEGRFHYDRKRDSGGQRAEDNLDIPRGANAGDSGMVLAYLRLRRETDPLPPGVLVINCGLHDIKTKPGTGEKQIPLPRFRENLAAILEEAKAMDQKVAWLRLTPVVDEVHNARSKAFHRFAADVAVYNAAADEIMRAAGVEIIDTHSFCLQFVPHALIDHIHYTEEARKQQGEFIAREIIARFGK